MMLRFFSYFKKCCGLKGWTCGPFDFGEGLVNAIWAYLIHYLVVTGSMAQWT